MIVSQEDTAFKLFFFLSHSGLSFCLPLICTCGLGENVLSFSSCESVSRAEIVKSKVRECLGLERQESPKEARSLP